MRKKLIYPMVVFLGLFLLIGCSAVEEVSESVDYVTKTIEYIEQVQNFVDEAPQLLENITDPAVLENIEQKLTNLQEKTAEFNDMTPPEIAKEIHDSILKYSQELEKEIETVLTNITEGKFDSKIFETEVLQDLKSIAEFLDKVQNLQ